MMLAVAVWLLLLAHQESDGVLVGYLIVHLNIKSSKLLCDLLPDNTAVKSKKNAGYCPGWPAFGDCSWTNALGCVRARCLLAPNSSVTSKIMLL
jgi:hypothetical protein